MATALEIDRSALADTAQADQLAALIVSQVSAQLANVLPLPVEAVAKACGILDIQPLQTEGFVGGLIQDANKNEGYVLVQAGMRPDRTRFTIAHELGHFVNLRHVPPAGSDRMLCSKADLKASGLADNSRHGMEVQSNEVASNLLMPKSVLVSQPFMKGSPEISRILALQNLCEVSKEAAARRYTEIHGDDFAIVFSKDGYYLYSVRSRDFPYINLQKNQPIYNKTTTREFRGAEGAISDQDESDAHYWLNDRNAARWELWEEVLVQAEGYRMTLLVGEQVEDD
jgi:Zn-dependent peptidase ImmA (M78 family)